MLTAAERTEERRDLEGLLGEIARFEAVIDAWDEAQRATVVAWSKAVEALHAEALQRLVRSLKSDPAALAAMKRALSDEVVYAVLRKHEIVKASLAERVERGLSSVRPMLATHGGDVELIRVEPPRVLVRFTGACDGCPASTVTFHEGVKKAIEGACPEITEIVQVKGLAVQGATDAPESPFASRGLWRFAARLGELRDGGAAGVSVDGEQLLLARRGAEVSCFRNACAHLGLRLDEGEVRDGVIECPHHGFQYDLASGECLTEPTVQLLKLPVRIRDGAVEVRAK